MGHQAWCQTQHAPKPTAAVVTCAISDGPPPASFAIVHADQLDSPGAYSLRTTSRAWIWQTRLPAALISFASALVHGYTPVRQHVIPRPVGEA